ADLHSSAIDQGLADLVENDGDDLLCHPAGDPTGVGQCVDLSGAEGSVVSEIELGETIISTASISGDALYIRSDGSLWKIAGPPPSKGEAEAKSQSAP
ncbi:MAG: hypothetical protein VCA35_09805, partial [Roseibacillus sp.]